MKGANYIVVFVCIEDTNFIIPETEYSSFAFKIVGHVSNFYYENLMLNVHVYGNISSI